MFTSNTLKQEENFSTPSMKSIWYLTVFCWEEPQKGREFRHLEDVRGGKLWNGYGMWFVCQTNYIQEERRKSLSSAQSVVLKHLFCILFVSVWFLYECLFCFELSEFCDRLFPVPFSFLFSSFLPCRHVRNINRRRRWNDSLSPLNRPTVCLMHLNHSQSMH